MPKLRIGVCVWQTLDGAISHKKARRDIGDNIAVFVCHFSEEKRFREE